MPDSPILYQFIAHLFMSPFYAFALFTLWVFWRLIVHFINEFRRNK